MKNRRNISSDKRLSILLVTKLPRDEKTITETISHMYPTASVKCIDADAQVTDGAKGSIQILNTHSLSEARVEFLLDSLPDVPTIIVVDDFSQVRTHNHFLTGRRSIITRPELRGMGLLQAMHHLQERQRLHEQLQRASQHLKELSTRDELTGFLNHHHFNDALNAEVKKAGRYKRPLSLIITSLKNFTTINKLMGHSEGDRVLMRVSELLRTAVRDVDIVARYGDNEFAVILPESEENAATLVAKRIQEALSTLKLPCDDDTKILTRFGISTLADEIRTKEELLGAALSALLEAKKSDDGSICTSADIEAKKNPIRENKELIERLRDSIHNLAIESDRTFFQSLMRSLSEVPSFNKAILPHSERVSFFAKRLAERINLNHSEIVAIQRAGILHDAGKLAIDSEINCKQEKLSFSEMELMKHHPQFASRMIGTSPFFTMEPATILHHHERFDGTGYPDGLAGHDIPVGARIVAIAEAWDAMTSPQSYRATPMSLDHAIVEMRANAGSQFDGELVNEFINLITS